MSVPISCVSKINVFYIIISIKLYMCTFGIAYYPFDKDSSRYKNRGFSVDYHKTLQKRQKNPAIGKVSKQTFRTKFQLHQTLSLQTRTRLVRIHSFAKNFRKHLGINKGIKMLLDFSHSIIFSPYTYLILSIYAFSYLRYLCEISRSWVRIPVVHPT